MSIADLWKNEDKMVLASKEYDSLLGLSYKAIKRWPNDLTVKRDLTSLLYRVASVFVKDDDLEQGLSYYKQALKIFQQLVTAEPTNGRAKRDLGWSHYFVGDTLLKMNSMDSGWIELDKGLSIIVTRCVAFPDAADARKDVLTYLNSVLAFHVVANQQSQAIEECKQVLLALQPVVESNPNNLALSNLYQQIQLSRSELQKEVASVQENLK
jgi:tetratricopeptide (TPR) repeat protein